jgi:hypothetical protein
MKDTPRREITAGDANRLPLLLCGHTLPPVAHSYKARCPQCGSFWDRDALDTQTAYDRSYPEQRSHFDPLTGRLKVRTLRRWLAKLGIRTEDLAACEVGFGGGFCLSFLQETSRCVFGIEAISENIEHAVRLGLRRDSLYHAGALSGALPQKVDLWIFQDSFEHLDDPSRFLQWLIDNSSERSRVLVVAPQGGSISERMMGTWWPHKVGDHRFHWTRQGMVDFFSRRGYALEESFFPAKYLSLRMASSHLLLKAVGPKRLEPWLRRIPRSHCAFLFNFGEMGLLFRKRT